MNLATVIAAAGLLAFFTEVAHGDHELNNDKKVGDGCAVCLGNGVYLYFKGNWVLHPCGSKKSCKMMGFCKAECE